MAAEESPIYPDREPLGIEGMALLSDTFISEKQPNYKGAPLVFSKEIDGTVKDIATITSDRDGITVVCYSPLEDDKHAIFMRFTQHGQAMAKGVAKDFIDRHVYVKKRDETVLTALATNQQVFPNILSSFRPHEEDPYSFNISSEARMQILNQLFNAINQPIRNLPAPAKSLKRDLQKIIQTPYKKMPFLRDVEDHRILIYGMSEDMYVAQAPQRTSTRPEPRHSSREEEAYYEALLADFRDINMQFNPEQYNLKTEDEYVVFAPANKEHEAPQIKIRPLTEPTELNKPQAEIVITWANQAFTLTWKPFQEINLIIGENQYPPIHNMYVQETIHEIAKKMRETLRQQTGGRRSKDPQKQLLMQKYQSLVPFFEEVL